MWKHVVAGAFAGVMGLGSQVSSAQALEVAASFFPVHSLVASVMGDTGTPVLLRESSNSEHDVALTPGEVQKFANAELVFRISPKLEGFMNRDEWLQSGKIVNLVGSKGDWGSKRGKGRRDRDSGEDRRGTHRADGDAYHDDHDDNPRDRGGRRGDRDGRRGDNEPHWRGGGHGGSDFHIWLDPIATMDLVEEIGAVLIEKDPARADVYKANVDATILKLRDLHRELKDAFGKSNLKAFIGTHNAYMQLAERYDLPYRGGLLGPDGHDFSSRRPSDQRRAVELVKRFGVACLLSEDQFNSPVAELMVKDHGLKLVKVDIIGADQKAGKELYFDLMRAIKDDILACGETTPATT